MKQVGNMRVLFIAGFGPIVRDVATSHKLYNRDLGISFTEESGGYYHTEALQGAKKGGPGLAGPPRRVRTALELQSSLDLQHSRRSVAAQS